MISKLIKLIICTLLLLLVVSCNVSYEEDVKDSNVELTSGSVSVQLIIPNYASMHDTRVIHPSTQYVALLIGGVLFDELDVSSGVITDYNSDLASTWSGTFSGIPATTYNIGDLTIELRDVNHTSLTSGSNASEVIIEAGQTTSGIPIYCTPSTPTTLTLNTSLDTNSVSAGDMEFYSIDTASGWDYVIDVTSTSGEVDVYLFDSMGIPVVNDTLSGSITSINYTAVDAGIMYIGVYGVNTSSYNVLVSASILAPTTVDASVNVHSSKVVVTWDEVATIDGYNVYRADSFDGVYTQLNASLLTDLTYEDSTVVADTTYYYKVESVVGAVTSDLSVYAEGSAISDFSSLYLAGNISTVGKYDYYSFEADGVSTYYIYWDDRFSGSGTYSLDVLVKGYSNDFTSYDFNYDSGFNTPRTVTPAAGTYYIRVQPYSSNNTGSYGIRVHSDMENITLSSNLTMDLDFIVY